MIDFKFSTDQVRRLAGKQGWPFIQEAQMELARILASHAADEDHAERIITYICESWDRCPAPQELRAELRPRIDIPDTPKTCRLGMCDGSGWVEVYALHTLVSIPGGAAYKEKKIITREQYNALCEKIDWKEQTAYSGVDKCACRSESIPTPSQQKALSGSVN